MSTIENSPTWNADGEKDAIIITFDEDNNNLSLGIGNEGNNVPMIVIPNGGAVTACGMQSGPFTTDSYYNEYSLMATIEDALRTAPGTLAPAHGQRHVRHTHERFLEIGLRYRGVQPAD